MTFSLDIKEFAEKTERNVNDVKQTVAIDLFGSIIKSSPVDTGRFRGNWNASINSPDLSASSSIDPSGQGSTSKMAQTIETSTVDDTLYISNNLPYAQRLEYGWSKQAPSGMVRVNIARFQAAIQKAIAKLPK
jgi:hypothetical protein